MSASFVFAPEPAALLEVHGSSKFLARLAAGDISRLAEGECLRTVMLTASAAVLGPAQAVRLPGGAVQLLLTGARVDALEAWVRQVAAAFGDEIVKKGDCAFRLTGELPVEQLRGPAMHGLAAAGVTVMNLGWHRVFAGEAATLEALRGNLLKVGAQEGDPAAWDALRILAREGAEGAEWEEGSDPFAAGFAGMLDFSDPARVFIGRALAESRAAAGGCATLALLAFDKVLGAGDVAGVPAVITSEGRCPFTSLAAVPDMHLTAGLAAVPADVAKEGELLECEIPGPSGTVRLRARVLGPQTA